MDAKEMSELLRIVERRIRHQVSGRTVFRKATAIEWISFNSVAEVANEEDEGSDDDIVVVGQFGPDFKGDHELASTVIVSFEFRFKNGTAELGFFKDEYWFSDCENMKGAP